MAHSQLARPLFAPLAPSYQRWARLLGLGQDGRWRRVMVAGLEIPRDSLVLDVAAGTGSITRLLQDRGHRVAAVDVTPEMIRQHPGPHRVLARGEELPFAGSTFDAVTFGYLLRYVDDPTGCLAELGRVVKPGGMLGMVEFGLPTGIWRHLWRFYSGSLLPLVGRVIGGGWQKVASFLPSSIEEFHRAHSDQVGLWRAAGLGEVTIRRMSLGGGLVMWARKP